MRIAEQAKTDDPAAPVVGITEENKPFWDACDQERLVAQRCHVCGKFWFPPSSECPRCLLSDYSWDELSGRGEVYSFVIFHHQYHPAYPPPYNVAVVALAEGIRMPSNIVDIELGELAIGLPVRVCFEEMAGGIVLPKFRVTAASDEGQ